MCNYTNNLNNLTTYTHSTKEVIQLIKYITGEIIMVPPYDILCFRTAICNKESIKYTIDFKDAFLNSDICIIEICSLKTYCYDGKYLHHLCVDKRFSDDYKLNTPIEILNKVKITSESDDEIENDILEIQKLIHPRKMILVSHYNTKINGEPIKSRNHLIQLLHTISLKHSIPFCNPTDVLKGYAQNEIITDDLGHFTNLGLIMISEHLNQMVKDIIINSCS
jgi:hypothetical protein